MEIEQLYKLFLQHPQVVTDSRQIKSGCIFFSLKGDKFDGNEFAEQALVQGAAYAVIDNPLYATDERCILVKDTLTTLQVLANHHRKHFHIPVIAITGSNGKTTTKELLFAVMNSHYPTHATQGNFNNHIGVPLTLLMLRSHHEVAIIEMGANHQGEIDALCRIAAPTHGLITNIGKAHLEGFGGIEGVKRGKSELYRYLAEKRGLAFVNAGDRNLIEVHPPHLRSIRYLRVAKPDARNIPAEVSLVNAVPFLTVEFLNENSQLMSAHSNLVGEYNFDNIMTAIALGKYFKVPGAKIKTAIEAYTPDNSRSQIVKTAAYTLILDAYNANPSSMKAAIDNIASVSNNRRIVILGDMRELGEQSVAEHQAIVDYASGKEMEIILCGEDFGKTSFTEQVKHFANKASLKAWFQTTDLSGAYILLKGSRGMKMESILE